MIIHSCKNCQKRSYNCHTDCEDYIKEKIEYEKIRKLMRADRDLYDYKASRRFEIRAKYLRKYGKSY